MSSVGYVYVQEMNDQSSATQGPFYITSTLKVEHPGIKVRLNLFIYVYMSHVFLFFSNWSFGSSAFLSDKIFNNERI